MQTVKSCCCGCSLRTGTLILLWLGVAFTALGLLSDISTGVSQNVFFPYILMDVLIRAIVAGIYAKGIYGVEKERPAYLKPYLALQVISMVIIIILMIGVAIGGAGILTTLLSGSLKNEGYEETMVAVEIIEILGLLGLGIIYYFFIVVLSFYKELKGEIPQS